MTEKKATWTKFTIICHRCGRHEDEGVTVTLNRNRSIEINCVCGESENDFGKLWQ